MTKIELIEALSKQTSLTAKRASDIVNMVFDCFTDTQKKGDRIEIRGFGSFCVREYNAYTGTNPMTGKKVAVKPKRLPFFRAGKELKDRVNTASS